MDDKLQGLLCKGNDMNVDVQQFFSAEQCLNFLLLGQ